MADFTTPPLFEAPARGNPLEFWDETYSRKTRGMGQLYGEKCVILVSTVFDWSTRVTDRRTDGQTDRQTDRQTELPWHIRAIAYMLSRVKTRNNSKWHTWQSDHQFRSNLAIEAASCKQNWHVESFYRAMHYSAKCGLAIVCHPSVRLSICL